MKRLRRDRRAVSNVIVVMLSLVLVVIIVSNVILWNYQMNQLDWEKMQEKITLTNAESRSCSPWSASQYEYTTNIGSRLNGTYTDTQAADGNYETFREENARASQNLYELDLNGKFVLNVLTYPLARTKSVEIQVRYRANDSSDLWFLKAYNWTKGEYSNLGFNSTAGDSPITQFKYYSVNLTSLWRTYVQDNGTIKVQLCDTGPDLAQTTVDIDFLGVRAIVGGARFSLRNDGSETCHVVAIWTVNSTMHERYAANYFLSYGTNVDYYRPDVDLSESTLIIKVVTERGNVAVFRMN